MSDSLPDNAVFACNLTAMSPEQRQRHEGVVRELFQSPQEVRELPDGYGWRWDKAKMMLAAEFITLERLCCPFFDFALSIESGSDSLRLRITGREGVKEFIRAEFGDVLAPGRQRSQE
jgi:hypothetical protein